MMNPEITPVNFLVLGTARTGSNYLMSLMGSHQNIRTYGELFNLDALNPSLLTEFLNDPIQYLKKRMTPKAGYPESRIGFKIFYEHLTDAYFDKLIDPAGSAEVLKKRTADLEACLSDFGDEQLREKFKEVWDYLIDNKAIRIIHLKRRNKLETLVSLKSAFLFNEWLSLNSKNRKKKSISLEPDECNYFFNRVKQYESDYTAYFRQHDQLEVFYEDLLTHKDAELNRIFNFLGLTAKTATTVLQKQNIFPLAEIVTNYTTLEEHFRYTEWNEFFI